MALFGGGGVGWRDHPRRPHLRRTSLKVLAPGLAAAALLGSASTPAQASHHPQNPPMEIGIHDSSINRCDRHGTNIDQPNYSGALNAVNDSRWPGLHIGTARALVPWDVADPQGAYATRMARAQRHHNGNQLADLQDAQSAITVEGLCLNEWLAGMEAAGIVPEVAFNPDPNYLTFDGKHQAAPSLPAYKHAIRAFVRRYSACSQICALPPVGAENRPYPDGTGPMAPVHIIASWNEPNFGSWRRNGFADLPEEHVMPRGNATFDDPRCSVASPDACGPVLAAKMWNVVSLNCPSCTVIAGDFTATGGMETRGGAESYLDIYTRHLIRRPRAWALHPYLEISNFEWDVKNHLPITPLANTETARFAAKLSSLGYGSHTKIILDEISAFQVDMFKHGLSDQPSYSPSIQARAVRYLISDLMRAGGATQPGEPKVVGAYYLRFSDGYRAPNRALVLSGEPQPAYYVLAHRQLTKEARMAPLRSLSALIRQVRVELGIT